MTPHLCKFALLSVVLSLVDGARKVNRRNTPSEPEAPSPNLLHQLLDPEEYDKHLSPSKLKNANATTDVKLDIYVESITSFEEATMDFDIDFYLHLHWSDPRLRFAPDGAVLNTNDADIESKFWWPDLYFANAKTAMYHHITTSNLLIRVSSTGEIFISRRITAKMSCFMELARFPADEQYCYIKMLSYYTTTDLVNMTWLTGNDSVVLDPHVNLPDFKVTKVYADYCNGAYSSGTYSCLLVNLTMTRFAGFQIFQVFIPTTTVVVVSWTGFWISPRAVPARATLSVTTFLALATTASGIRSSLPPVSYATAVDVWSTICSLFVLASLVEFAIAYYLWEKEELVSKLSDEQVTQAASPGLPKNAVRDLNAYMKDRERSKDSHGRKKSFRRTAAVAYMKSRMDSSKVDKISRFLFPFLYAIVCLVYFMVYKPPSIETTE